VTDTGPAPGRRAAASYLRELLLRPGAYRRLWEQHVVRARPGEINQLAACEVIARYLWSHPRGPQDADVHPHQLKDTVFGLSDHEADRLWRLWEGSGLISVLSGPRAMGNAAEQEVRAALGPRRHQTLSLHDHVHVGSDGRLARARTLQVIEAVAQNLDRIPFLHDTNSLTLDVGQGCKGISGYPYEIREDVFATDILLASVLAVGETSTLEYWTTYRYPGDPLDPQEREFRRAVMSRMENFDMRVEFHPDRLPAALWWASWDGVEGEIIEQEEVSLDSQNSVHRYLRFIEKTVVGFYWSW
jgi:hypothetical protein